VPLPEKNRPLFTKILHSFKRTHDIDADTGEAELSPEIGKFSLQCIAIGGCIGTGLLVASSKSLVCGPGPILVAYIVVSIFIYCMCQALGELTVAMPIKGGFTIYSSTFIDESWGFAMAWNYCFQWMCLFPIELVASTMTFAHWPNVFKYYPNWAIITTQILVIAVVNMLSVKFYGYVEVFFSIIKITAIVSFILVELSVAVGVFGPPLGFTYWTNPGMVSSQGWIHGIIQCIIAALFGFAGTELVSMSAVESKDPPEKAIPLAIKNVFWKIFILYICSMFILTLVVPFNHPNLYSSHGGTSSSPFVVALEYFHSPVPSNIMNIIIIVAILSVANSSIYATSRTLSALAVNKQAPSFLKYLDKKKRPIFANMVVLAFGLTSYISIAFPDGAQTIFSWLVSLSGVSVLFSYFTICVCHIRFRRALKYYRIGLDQLRFKSTSGIFGSIYGVAFCILVGLSQLYICFCQRTSLEERIQFGVAWLALLILYVGHKVFTMVRSKSVVPKFLVRYDDIDMLQARF
ncbi:general amino acid permease, partial [Scheffersomyces stipitis CBS 6054]